MLTGELKSQVDTLWNSFWTGGIANPLKVVEQITYLLFIKRLDELQTLEENKSARLGKPIIFAKNNDHAEFIEQRFNINYPQYNGKFARVITYKTEYAQSLIDAFSVKDSEPHVAISVDMLDTGIDVPEVVNLVFFKQVHSKTKFWQMIGRGTRLCPDLYAPGKDKMFFNIFDFCQNFEYFRQNPDVSEGKKSDSLDTRLFKLRLALLDEIANPVRPKPMQDVTQQETELKTYTVDLLHSIVSNMTLDNISVRPQRLYVERYTKQYAALIINLGKS